MRLVNDFEVPRPVGEAWAVLTDVERIAPCMPGAQLTEVEGDVYRGTVRVKVGPVVAKFSGQATFVDRDDAAHRAVLQARGKEATGKGLASAEVTMELTPHGDGTEVHVVTDLSISGRLAQFGQGAVSDISNRMLGQFLDCLESRVLTEERVPAAASADPPEARDAAAAPEPATSMAATEVRRIEGPEAEPVDLLRSAGGPIARRLVPAAIVVVCVVVVIVLAVAFV